MHIIGEGKCVNLLDKRREKKDVGQSYLRSKAWSSELVDSHKTIRNMFSLKVLYYCYSVKNTCPKVLTLKSMTSS